MSKSKVAEQMKADFAKKVDSIGNGVLEPMIKKLDQETTSAKSKADFARKGILESKARMQALRDEYKRKFGKDI